MMIEKVRHQALAHVSTQVSENATRATDSDSQVQQLKSQLEAAQQQLQEQTSELAKLRSLKSNNTKIRKLEKQLVRERDQADKALEEERQRSREALA